MYLESNLFISPSSWDREMMEYISHLIQVDFFGFTLSSLLLPLHRKTGRDECHAESQ